MKKTKSFVSFILIAVLVLGIMLSGTYIPALADDNISADDTAKLVSDYADDRVLVVMTQTASRAFKTYTAADFPEIDCKNVEVLNDNTGELVKQKLESMKTAELTEIYEKTTSAFKKRLDVDNYRQIVCLELNQHGKDNVQLAIKKLNQRSDVQCAEPDYYVYAESTPNDEYYSQQWSLTRIAMPLVWDKMERDGGLLGMVTVGVLDSGIDADPSLDHAHPELLRSISTLYSRDYVTSNGTQGGYADQYGHGTHVAGIIAAAGNNGEGVCGVGGYDPNEDEVSVPPLNQAIRVASFRVLEDGGKGRSSNVAEAIDDATELEIPILNLSLGYLAPSETSEDEGEKYEGIALKTAMLDYPGLLVCSAGNNGINTDTAGPLNHYPSEYDIPNMIVVGACTSALTKVQGTNYGQTTVDIFAPGQDVLSCYPRAQCYFNSCDEATHFEDGYHYGGLTSIATPHVTAVAALVMSKNPDLTPEQIIDRIMDGAIVYASLANYCASGGILNAYNALYPS